MFYLYFYIVVSDGLMLFRNFLCSEYSEENIEFWIACEEYKQLKSRQFSPRAQKIYSDFVTVHAPKEVIVFFSHFYQKSNLKGQISNRNQNTDIVQHYFMGIFLSDIFYHCNSAISDNI